LPKEGIGNTAGETRTPNNSNDEIARALAMQAIATRQLTEVLENGITAKTLLDRTEFERYNARNEKMKEISRL
jgi:hypothetical protein